MIHITLGSCRFSFWRRPLRLLSQGNHPESVCSARRGVFVQLAHGSRKAGLGWFDSSSAWRPSAYSQGLGPQARMGCGCGPGRGASRAAGGCGPTVRGTASRGRARTALPASLGRQRQPQPGERCVGDPAPGPHCCRSPGEPILQGMGEAAASHFPWKGNALGCARFPGSAGARLPRGRVTRSPTRSPRLARCLFVSPRLPSSQTNGCRQEIGRAPGEPHSSAARRGRREAGRLRGSPAGAGAWGMF